MIFFGILIVFAIYTGLFAIPFLFRRISTLLLTAIAAAYFMFGPLNFLLNEDLTSVIVVFCASIILNGALCRAVILQARKHQWQWLNSNALIALFLIGMPVLGIVALQTIDRF
jgi:hypothetical protein